MAFRNVYVENDVHIRVKNEQLVVQKETEEYTIPLEDINSICIESQKTSITTYTLRKIIEHDIILYICDSKHLPTGILIGTNNYSRQLKNLQMQFNVSKPLTKRIWQNIVNVKVLNQAECLKFLGIDGYEKLREMTKGITSGDSNNVEAKAASYYFKTIFGNNFNRDIDCLENAALNYGYAIVRGMIARTLIMYGFEPALGIFHHNQLNNFNLADDFIECFRPVVDLYVLTHVDFRNKYLIPEEKKKIYNLVNCLVLIDGKKFNIQGAIEYMIKSYSTSINKNENLIKLPYLIELEEYRYA
jgi:CRISPR-associated protein Cas1